MTEVEQKEFGERSLEELNPHPMNPKIHTEEQVEHLAQSIREFSQYQPVIIDENNVILAGHGTVLALKKLGRKKTIVQFFKEGASEVDKLAYLLEDNHSTASTPMDVFKQETLVRELKEKGYPLQELGLQMELVQPETVGTTEQIKQQGGVGEAQSISQVVVVFEAAVFDDVMKKFDLIQKRHPELRDNTEVFNMLLGNFEEAMGHESY